LEEFALAEEIDEQLFRRLVLRNQFLILSHLDKDARAHWEREAEIVSVFWPLDELSGVGRLRSYVRQPFTDEMRSELLDTLDMFEVLQDAEDRGAVANFEPVMNAAFPGYSGNEETEFLSYYRDIVERGQRWPDLRKTNPRDLNSHAPHREAYARMLAKWTEFGRSRVLSTEQFERILFEWVHPENRRPRG
jgi:uncharacterized protein YfbU (UPF0304 family)